MPNSRWITADDALIIHPLPEEIIEELLDWFDDDDNSAIDEIQAAVDEYHINIYLRTTTRDLIPHNADEIRRAVAILKQARKLQTLLNDFPPRTQAYIATGIPDWHALKATTIDHLRRIVSAVNFGLPKIKSHGQLRKSEYSRNQLILELREIFERYIPPYTGGDASDGETVSERQAQSDYEWEKVSFISVVLDYLGILPGDLPRTIRDIEATRNSLTNPSDPQQP